MKEKDLQRAVLDLLHLFRWAPNHVRPLLDSHGRWTTGTTAKGWPDIVALRGDWLVAIECKGTHSKMQPGQLDWLARFAALPHGLAWLVKPTSDLELLARWLAYPAEAEKVYGWSASPPVQRAML